jgi:transcriptional regulator with XRE-family HTH domain
MNFFRELRNNYNLTREELASKLSIDKHTIALYETNRSNPLFKTLIKMSFIFEVSMDYLISRNECQYPGNMKIFRMALELDKSSNPEGRQNIKGAIKSLLGGKADSNEQPKQDVLDLDLSADFHQNLKVARNYRVLTQLELAGQLGVSRVLIAQYELDCYPNLDKLMHISNTLGISIHFLSTGSKLLFNFKDKNFGRSIFLADQNLSMEHQRFLIEMMEAVLKK